MVEITRELVREFLDYDAETGVLTWRSRDRKWFKTNRAWNTWNTRFSGQRAGGNNGVGYIEVRAAGGRHLAHRLIWLWMTGEFPEHEIDHGNHARDDNRWANLQAVSNSENRRNMSRRYDNTSGVTGVCWANRESKWRAGIKANGLNRFLGYFADKNDAIAARKAAEIKHGFHANHGKRAA